MTENTCKLTDAEIAAIVRGVMFSWKGVEQDSTISHLTTWSDLDALTQIALTNMVTNTRLLLAERKSRPGYDTKFAYLMNEQPFMQCAMKVIRALEGVTLA